MQMSMHIIPLPGSHYNLPVQKLRPRKKIIIPPENTAALRLMQLLEMSVMSTITTSVMLDMQIRAVILTLRVLKARIIPTTCMQKSEVDEDKELNIERNGSRS